MGKKLSDLNLGESGPPTDDALKLARREADAAVDRLTEMLDSDRYNFAWGTLTDLRLTIEQRGQVSAAQLQAIDNIQHGGDRHETQREGWSRHEARTGRRYEGWEPSR